MEEPIEQSIDDEVRNAVRRISGAGQHGVPLKDLVEHDAVYEPTEADAEPTHPARVAAGSSLLAPGDRDGPIGSRSAAHGAGREEQDDQHTKPVSKTGTRTPRIRRSPGTGRHPRPPIRHRCEGRHGASALWPAVRGRSGAERIPAPIIGCRRGTLCVSTVPCAAASCPTPWRPAMHQGRSPSSCRPLPCATCPPPNAPTAGGISTMHRNGQLPPSALPPCAARAQVVAQTGRVAR